MNKLKADVSPAPAPASPTIIDEHHGHGGSYRVDEAGARTLVERTQPAGAEASPVSPAAPPANDPKE